METNITAVGYARYSTDNQTENSIAYQKNAIIEYCTANNINLTKVYCDEGKSGTNINRAGFMSMLSDARQGLFNAVVIYDVSRGSRDVGDWFTFRKEMLMLNIKVISVTQNLGDITNSNDFLVELISVGMGQREVLETRSKSIAGVAVKAKEGVFLGGTPPLGYDVVNGEYVINPIEAKIVKTIFSIYSNGGSYDQILYAISGAKGKKGQPLGKNSLSSILRNERYVGTYTWNKRHVKLFRKWAGGKPNEKCVRIENSIPPIINNDVWERTLKRMNDSKKNATNKAKRTYLLTGLIKCDTCGATYIGHTTTNKKGYSYSSYCCGNKYRTKTCDSKNINANEIETFVIANIKDYLVNMNLDEEVENVYKKITSAGSDVSKERKELAEITTKINNGMKAIMSGMIFPELQDEIDKMRMRKSELEEIISVNSKKDNTVTRDSIRKVFTDSIENLDTDSSVAVKNLINEIYAHKDGTFTVIMGVHINGCGGRI